METLPSDVIAYIVMFLHGKDVYSLREAFPLFWKDSYLTNVYNEVKICEEVGLPLGKCGHISCAATLLQKHPIVPWSDFELPSSNIIVFHAFECLPVAHFIDFYDIYFIYPQLVYYSIQAHCQDSTLSRDGIKRKFEFVLKQDNKFLRGPITPLISSVVSYLLNATETNYWRRLHRLDITSAEECYYSYVLKYFPKGSIVEELRSKNTVKILNALSIDPTHYELVAQKLKFDRKTFIRVLQEDPSDHHLIFAFVTLEYDDLCYVLDEVQIRLISVQRALEKSNNITFGKKNNAVFLLRDVAKSVQNVDYYLNTFGGSFWSTIVKCKVQYAHSLVVDWICVPQFHERTKELLLSKFPRDILFVEILRHHEDYLSQAMEYPALVMTWHNNTEVLREIADYRIRHEGDNIRLGYLRGPGRMFLPEM